MRQSQQQDHQSRMILLSDWAYIKSGLPDLQSSNIAPLFRLPL